LATIPENCTKMASLPCLLFSIHFIVIMSSSLPTNSDEVFAKQSPMSPSTKPVEKITQLHFYFHNNVTEKNPTAMRIVGPPKGFITQFGTVVMMDDPLTEGPSPSSKLVGRSQWIYALASQHEFGSLLMVTNFFFTEGIYNGSTLSILGRNPTLLKAREVAIVGGTGIFKYARGSAVLTTYMFDYKAGVAIVEYNVTVLHVWEIGWIWSCVLYIGFFRGWVSLKSFCLISLICF